MNYLLCFLLLPFAVLGTPVSSGLTAASTAPLANLTSPAGDSSIPGLFNTGTTVNGTDETPNPEEWCPAKPAGHHVDIIDVGFQPFTVSRTLFISGMSRAVTYRRPVDRLDLRGHSYYLR